MFRGELVHRQRSLRYARMNDGWADSFDNASHYFNAAAMVSESKAAESLIVWNVAI
jgi:hypothetical protein